MAQSSGPISQGTATERQFTDILWRDRFGDEPGVLSDMDGTSYALALPAGSDIVSVGSSTQASLATVAGFVHRIPAGSPEPITIPPAVGSTRTDIIGLRYDPAYTGLPGPVRLFRIAGTSASIPTYDSAPPGVEDLPLWAITRAVGQGLNQATVQRLFPRIAPSLEIAAGVALPLNSPLSTVVRQGSTRYRRQLNGSSPEWASDNEISAKGQYIGPIGSSGYVDIVHGLGVAPSQVFIQIADSSGPKGSMNPVVTSRSSTVFRVNFFNSTNGAVLADNPTAFDWMAIR